jgi:hypothetical protein
METADECNVHNFDRPLVLVEYPGVVENEDRAIKTMGGLHNISTVSDKSEMLVVKQFCSCVYGICKTPL